MTTAEKLKKSRLVMGYSQQELADLAGITRISVGQYERGDRHPKVETLLKLTNALGVSIFEFIPVSTNELLEELKKRKQIVHVIRGGQ